MLIPIMFIVVFVIQIYLELRHPAIMDAIIEKVVDFFLHKFMPIYFVLGFLCIRFPVSIATHWDFYFLLISPTSYLSPQQTPLLKSHLL